VREAIAAAGRAEALERHTYRHRMERLLGAVDSALERTVGWPGTLLQHHVGAEGRERASDPALPGVGEPAPGPTCGSTAGSTSRSCRRRGGLDRPLRRPLRLRPQPRGPGAEASARPAAAPARAGGAARASLHPLQPGNDPRRWLAVRRGGGFPAAEHRAV